MSRDASRPGRDLTTPRPSLILDTVLDGVFHTTLLFSLFLLFTGHNAPGGGFVGGLVAAISLVLRYVSGGRDEVDRVARVSPAVLLGSGLTLAATTSALGLVWGGAFLESIKVETDVPVLGHLKATSALPFDIGVYLVVVGLGLAILRTLGAAADEPADPEAACAESPTDVLPPGGREGRP